MKRGLVSILLVTIVVGLLLGGLSCGESEKTLGRNGLKLVNEDAICGAYVKLDIVRGDRDLAQLSDYFMTILEAEELSDFSIDVSQVDYFAVANEQWGEKAGVALGGFDFNDVRDSLRGLGFTQGKYAGIEFWRGYYEPYEQTGMGFFRDGLVWGDEESAKSIIRTASKIDPSFNELSSVREVVDRLTKWSPLLLMVSFDPLSDFDIPYAEVAAAAMAKKNLDIMRVSMVVKFTDEADALQLCKSVQAQYTLKGECDGKFAIVEYEMPIEEVQGW